MRVTCKYSGISYTIPQFSMSASNTVHPIFSVKQNSLLAQLKGYTAGTLTDEEKILLFLAMFNSTDLVIWEDAFALTPDTMGKIEANMELMACTVTRINQIKHPDADMPHVRVSKHGEANTADAIVGALGAWNECILSFAESHASALRGQQLLRIEETLARMVRLQQRNPAQYGRSISKWACTAADFPVFLVQSASGNQITCAEYWTNLIYRMAVGDNVGRIQPGDIMDIIEYCEENLPHGTIFASALMRTLREALRKQREFVGAPVTSGTRTFMILPLTPAEEANRATELGILAQMAESAPTSPPKREDFQDVLLFLRAQARYRAAQAAKTGEV